MGRAPADRVNAMEVMSEAAVTQSPPSDATFNQLFAGTAVMRLLLSAAIFVMLGCFPAHSKTLLEDVLFVLTSLEEMDSGRGHKTTVVQDGDSIHSEMSAHSAASAKPRVIVAATIKRVGACRFDVDYKMTGELFSAQYVVDFANSDVEKAHATEVRNFAGFQREAITIPGTTLCLQRGQTYFSPMAPGTCVGDLHVDFLRVPRESSIERMLATIRRLPTNCIPKLS
jgi:hypothetical protein